MNIKNIGAIIVKNYWTISLGNNSFFWDECREKGCISAGWSGLFDMDNINTLEELKYRYVKEGYGNKREAGQKCYQIWNYYNEVDKGDRILVRKGQKKILGIGTIIGNNCYSDINKISFDSKDHFLSGMDEARYSDIWDVEWFDFPEEGVEISKQQSWLKTFIKLDNNKVTQIFDDLKNKGMDVKVYR
ncbi:hypothetical protein [Methanolobus psychrotolerans]|uniref:hypothetical protein n=1 Tax=Methanolobus psychrotolerans TaxID=1874706 RepID=UPI000B916D93|nr:hypothetical protein [Methanolobus psychrotolerans]